jgi:hypothetical protein
MAEDIVRVLRILEYEGPRSAVEETLRNSIQGTRMLTGKNGRMRITGTVISQFPEILEEARQTACPKAIADLLQQIETEKRYLRSKDA